MITKYIVNNDKIDFYEGEKVVATLPNTTDHIKLAKLYNDQVFIGKDIKAAETITDYYQNATNSNLIKSLITLPIFIISVVYQLPLHLVFFWLTLYNGAKYVFNNRRFRICLRRLNHFKGIRKRIDHDIEELLKSNVEEKEDNVQFTFTNDQIVANHRQWLEEMGEYHDFWKDVDAIREEKVLIKK
jgi:hypothetical protein